jgi:hypothetical protein
VRSEMFFVIMETYNCGTPAAIETVKATMIESVSLFCSSWLFALSLFLVAATTALMPF